MAHPMSMSGSSLIRENEELRAKLAEAQEILRAIQAGEVDAFVIAGPQGEQIFTLKGAEHAYRVLVETMNEGAATVAADGTVLYCNQRLADLTGVAQSQITGNPISKLFAPCEESTFQALLNHALSGQALRAELELQRGGEPPVPAYISLRRIEGDEPATVCMVATDLTEHKRRDELVAAGTLARSILESTAEAIAVCDDLGHILAANEAMNRLCGMNPLFQAFDAVLPLEIVSPNSGSERFSILTVLHGDELRTRDVILRREDGQRLWLLLTAGRMSGPSGATGCVVTIADITERQRAEEAVKASEAEARARANELATIMDTVPAITFIAHDPECRVMTSSRAAHELLHTPLGSNLSQPLTPGERPSFRILRDGRELAPEEQPVQMAAATGRPVSNVELTVVFADGTARDVFGNAVPLLDENGQVRGAVGAFLDITDRKQFEQALLESEEQFRTLAESIPQLAWMADADGWIFWYNQRWYDYTGTTPEQMEGWGWQSVHDPRELSKILKRWRESIITGDPFDMVFPLRGADGVFRPFLTRVMPVRNQAGEIMRWFGTNTDISEQQRAEDSLRESEARFRSVLDASRDVIYRLNLQTGRYEYISPSAERVIGFSVDEIMSLDLENSLAMIHPDDLPAMRAVLAHLEEAGEGELEYRQRTRSGEYRWLSNRMSLIKDSAGRPLYRSGNIRDITERKQAEELLLRSEKLASVGRVAAAIAHEINNPLAAVTNVLYLAKAMPGLPEAARQYLEMADAELKRVAHITRQSLGFYRESNAPALSSVNQILDSAIDLLKNRIDAKQARIEKQWEQDVEITAVFGELRQVFSNLLANSLDAIDEHGIVKLRVTAGKAVNHGERRIRVTVADNGKGISANLRASIFEPFFTTKGTVGTGLGLWVSKEIIDKHGGTIRVRSRTHGPRRGTVFSVVLPVEFPVKARS